MLGEQLAEEWELVRELVGEAAREVLAHNLFKREER
jgi:hypothetical protein